VSNEASEEGGRPPREAGSSSEESAREAAPAEAPVSAPPAAATPPPPAAKGKGAPKKRRLAKTIAWIREHYCRMEPRTAGLFRWVLGFLCSADLIRHWKEARWFYSNDGVLTNHYHLYRPSSDYNFSLFHAFSSLEEVHVAFALALFCHLCFMIGWHTKLFSILSFIIVTSLDNRLVMVENGGYVDALLRSYRERKEKTVADLNDRYRPAWVTEQSVSLAVLLVILNLAVIYFFNVINKSGLVWRRGETVHYVLYLNRMVTGVAVFFREHLPFWSTQLITWSVLCLEASLVTWILSPFGRRYTRTLAMLGMFALHTAFGVTMRLGPFSWFLIGWSFLLMSPAQWDMLERWYRRRAVPLELTLDRRSPLAFAIGRLLARLDRLSLLRFAESPPDRADPELISARELDGDRVFTGLIAFRAIVQALPGGRYAFWVIRIGSLGLLGPILTLVSARRAGIARFFGLTLSPRGAEEVERSSPIGRTVARVGIWGREMFLVYFAICSVLQAFVENKAIPPSFAFKPTLIQGMEPIAKRLGLEEISIPLKPTLPKVMAATLVYPRMFQGWGMFAPNPITDDGSITIDARTIDGRQIDPFTGEAPDLDLTDARGLGLEQIWQDYFNRIRLDRNRVFRQGLKEYLQRWHLETGRPEDELVAFDVYWVRDQCPKPGDVKPYKNETIAILTYRKPGYQPPPGQPPLSREPKVESAEVVTPAKTPR
jgi:hypothetical protein